MGEITMRYRGQNLETFIRALKRNTCMYNHVPSISKMSKRKTLCKMNLTKSIFKWCFIRHFK